jgi:DNA-binding FadR family transcriptional regulator
MTGNEPRGVGPVLNWHQRIVDAIEGGDAAAVAAVAMTAVIFNGIRRYDAVVVDPALRRP